MASDKVLLVVGASGELGEQIVKRCMQLQSALFFTKVVATYCSNSSIINKYSTVATTTNHEHKNNNISKVELVWEQLDFNNKIESEKIINKYKPVGIIFTAIIKHKGAGTKEGEENKKGIANGFLHLLHSSLLLPSPLSFIALSTDQVFSGKENEIKNLLLSNKNNNTSNSTVDNCDDGIVLNMYKEDDICNPTNAYAKYKREMEVEMLKYIAMIKNSYTNNKNNYTGNDTSDNNEHNYILHNKNIIICRTSLILTLYPPGKAIKFLFNSMKQKVSQSTNQENNNNNNDNDNNNEKRMALFIDEPRNMSFSDDLAAALLTIVSFSNPFVYKLDSNNNNSNDNNNNTDYDIFNGILHLASDEPLNRYELSLKLYEVYKNDVVVDNNQRNEKFQLNKNKVTSALSKESNLNRPLDLSISTNLLSSLLLQYANRANNNNNNNNNNNDVRIRGVTEYLNDLKQLKENTSKDDGSSNLELQKWW